MGMGLRVYNGVSISVHCQNVSTQSTFPCELVSSVSGCQ
jgi:hypothetical protein